MPSFQNQIEQRKELSVKLQIEQPLDQNRDNSYELSCVPGQKRLQS